MPKSEIDALRDKIFKNAVAMRFINFLKRTFCKEKIHIVDIHAEATSEKLSLGYYLDGKVSIVAGTHTHVPTADARILPQGTGYITDVGMCGDFESILGFDPQTPVERLADKLTTQNRLVPSNGNILTICGIVADIDDKGHCTEITQIKETYNNI